MSDDLLTGQNFDSFENDKKNVKENFYKIKDIF